MSALVQIGDGASARVANDGCGVHPIGGSFSAGRLDKVIEIVAAETGQTRGGILCSTRGSPRSSEARFIVYYLMNTSLGHPLSEIGVLMRRDRTSVANGVQIVEGRRDDERFDTLIKRLEDRLSEVRLLAVRATGAARSGPKHLVEAGR
ncbi:hypothetical protein DLJ53_18140 [Acuticoccus sediminis]|uniref:Chromosomal replication initiator DnaA C-terminal domain-containing protein n=1 Tax=Acuticoccus sediminis TaxID=2184697 RepID=A0A8B2NN96_9HYPH|nr:helix-turn-helix domain-containing protein [Acuticoccus sediminis]RAI01137.1 hypothetical protein DLJ53_18140 [Acuticoccus sediminis]